MPGAQEKKRQDGGLQFDLATLRSYLALMKKALATPEARAKAVGYVRVSSKKQRDEGGSIEDQREALIRYAVLNGLDLVEVFVDGGISGGKAEDRRPGLSAALEAIKSGTASVFLTKHA